MSASSYYPSCVVNFRVQFDETLTVVTNTPVPLSVDSAVETVPNESSIAGREPLVTSGGVNTEEDTSSFILNRIPRSCSVEMPGYRQAGTFSVELDFKDMPIDPRTVRAASVEIHIGCVAPADFGAGVIRTNQYGQRSSVLRTLDSNGLPNKETLVMVGTIDNWSVDHSDKGSIVTMKGRDLRGALIDSIVSAGMHQMEDFFASIDTAESVDQVVSSILYLHPEAAPLGSRPFSKINVLTNEAEWPGGKIPAPWDQNLTSRHRHGAKGDLKSPRQTPNSEMGKTSFWDLIVRQCYLVGAIPYFVGADLVIRPARSIFDQANAGTALNPVPFKGNQPRTVDLSTGAPFDPALRYRRMVYGRDVQSLSFDRKFGGFQRPHGIRAVSVDGSSAERGTDRVVFGEWPPGSTANPVTGEAAESPQTTKTGSGGNGAQSEILNIPVKGVRDTGRLTEIARGIYEEMGRGEIGGSVSTPLMASFGGDNSDPDLVRLRPGDAVQLLVDTRNLTQISPLVSTLTDHFRTPFEEQVEEIYKRIGDRNLARVIVATTRGAIQQLPSFFRVSTVKYAWSVKGLKIDFDFQNYVVARSQFDDAGSVGVPSTYQQGVINTTLVRSPT